MLNPSDMKISTGIFPDLAKVKKHEIVCQEEQMFLLYISYSLGMFENSKYKCSNRQAANTQEVWGRVRIRLGNSI